MDEKDKKKRSADIHIRCYPEDKSFIEDRAKNGFGSGKSTMTNYILYVLHHFDDASNINMDMVDTLVRAISENRQNLASVHGTITRVPHELNAIGNNINQIAKAINTAMLKAKRDSKTPDNVIIKLLNFQNSLISYLKEIKSIAGSYEKSVASARTIINAVLRKEDEVLTRILVFPQVGNKYYKYCQLMRMLQDFQEEEGLLDTFILSNVKKEIQYKIYETQDELFKR